MLFSYYFDSEKTHLLNCRFNVLQFAEKAEGVVEIMFSSEISEVLNGVTKKKESSVNTFSFPPTPDGQTKHDIDFTRVRYADQQKWIFTVLNNKNSAEKAVVGLVSSTVNKNPLGQDIYHDDEEFNVELKANNLSILEDSYVPPILTQTLVDTLFDEAGYPERFSSFTATYDSSAKNYTVKDFRQDFLEEIPTQTAFKIQLDLAPLEFTPVSGERIFDLTIPQLGRISLLKSGLEYLIQDGLTNDIVRLSFDSAVKASDFFANDAFTTKAKMTIEGDGLGNLTITYYGQTLIGIYDPTKTFLHMDFKGAYAGVIL
ncbi:hypothetical protein LAV82_22875 [Bacillus sp. ILBB4]|nr:hypothetical protein [Bacillus sp. ILBB4]